MTLSDLLQNLCKDYQEAIASLGAASGESGHSQPDDSTPPSSKTSQEGLASTWEPEQVLKLLTTRDRIQHLIDYIAKQPDAQDIPQSFWQNLTEEDTKVRTKVWPELLNYKPVDAWRKNLKPPGRHWWWFPKPPEDPKDPYAWLWGGITLAVLTVNLALAQDIATRFLTGAPGVWSSIGAIAPVALALFAGGGALTKVGQQILESVLANKGPKRRHWPKLKFGLSVLLLSGLLIMHQCGLTYFAQSFNDEGESLYKEGRWATAQNHFERALNLTPDFPNAQFNLGVLYEDYQEVDQAQEQYLKAVQAGYLPAYNNLARLYIETEEYDEAAQLLRLALADKELPDAVKEEPDLEYVLRKNLGWVRLEQNRLLEAETELNEAIRLNEELDPPRPDAHCLLAQVLQRLDGSEALTDAQSPSSGAASQTIPESALEQWRLCLQYANRPEYDAWEGMARNALTPDTQMQLETAPNAN